MLWLSAGGPCGGPLGGPSGGTLGQEPPAPVAEPAAPHPEEAWHGARWSEPQATTARTRFIAFGPRGTWLLRGLFDPVPLCLSHSIVSPPVNLSTRLERLSNTRSSRFEIEMNRVCRTLLIKGCSTNGSRGLTVPSPSRPHPLEAVPTGLRVCCHAWSL